MLKNIIKVLFSNAILTLIGLINSFVFPIIMDVGSYASYQEYVLYLSYTNICHLGIASGMFLNYVGKKYKDTKKEIYKSEIFLIYIVLIGFSTIGLLAAGVTKSKMAFLVILTIFPQCVAASFQALYQAWERFTGYAIINALPKILFSIFTILSYLIYRKMSGNYVILIYILIQWGICLYFMAEFSVFTKGVKSAGILSNSNVETTKNGFLITLGNYVNLLFHLIDKQFVNLLYSTLSFAQYSFAMSTQNIMMIFITALANPFYPRLAKGDVDEKMISWVKEILIIFGAYSGCAYFGVSFFVQHFVLKYVESLKVVAIFFAVFPAMAVINVLYINLYKIRKKLKNYIFTLIGMLVVACFLNGVAVLLGTDYVGIAFATMVSYYVWLFYSQRDFDEINIGRKDILYLAGYFTIYFGTMKINNDVVGFVVYALVISLWNWLLYKEAIIDIFKKLKYFKKC